jgi:hypothetical protein
MLTYADALQQLVLLPLAPLRDLLRLEGSLS